MGWSRQIPYTMAKFYFFEKVVELFYAHVFTRPRETYSKGEQLGVTFLSGYTAGVICAIVSHPADTLVSLLGKSENKGKGFGQIASEFGYANLAKGLTTRILMIGTLTGLQWWIYDTFKTVLAWAAAVVRPRSKRLTSQPSCLLSPSSCDHNFPFFFSCCRFRFRHRFAM